MLVTADSASLAEGELAHCRAFADRWGIPWRPAATDELHDERYLANGTDRCYWCKSALMDQLDPIATELGATVVLGVNVDDDAVPVVAHSVRHIGERAPLFQDRSGRGGHPGARVR